MRKCIAKGVRPQLILVSREQLMSNIRPEKFYVPTRREQDIPAVPPKSASNTVTSWSSFIRCHSEVVLFQVTPCH